MFYCCFPLFRFFFFESSVSWVKAERQSASSAYDGACYLAAKYESGGNPDQVGGDGGKHVVNFSSTIVMSLGRLFGGAMKKIQLHMVRLNHILA